MSQKYYKGKYYKGKVHFRNPLLSILTLCNRTIDENCTASPDLKKTNCKFCVSKAYLIYETKNRDGRFKKVVSAVKKKLEGENGKETKKG